MLKDNMSFRQRAMEKSERMNKAVHENASGVDKGLIADFLKLSPEERLQANNNMLRVIMELREAYGRSSANRS
jgi:hypothetical protein